QYEAGGFFMLILHPFLTGRLARWRLVEQWLETTLAERDVWFAPLEDVAAHLDAVQDLRVETLPYYTGPQT
ncbi:MAG: ribulose phosphate epimerase, partial [Pseudomonadota bacterium]